MTSEPQSGQTSSAKDAEILRPSIVSDDARPVVAMTRIRVRHVWLLIPALAMFWRLYREAHTTPGFIRGQVSLANLWTLTNFSIWHNRRAMLRWSGSNGHVSAVRWTYKHAVEVWSSEWELHRVSSSAHGWDGDLIL